MKSIWQRLCVIVTMVCLIDSLIVLGSESGNRLVDFSLEDLHETKHSQSDMKDRITLVILQSRTTIQTAIDCKTELKKITQENQKVQMISIMDLRKRPSLVPKFALKSKIAAQDPTSKEIPFLLDWDGNVTKSLDGDDSKCMVLIIDPALNVVYKKEYNRSAIDSEIKPFLNELSNGQK